MPECSGLALTYKVFVVSTPVAGCLLLDFMAMFQTLLWSSPQTLLGL